MKIYVLSYNSSDGFMKRTQGVLGVFDSFERVQHAVDQDCVYYYETQIDHDTDGAVWHHFTNKGTYTIECFILNDYGIEDEDEKDYDIPDDVDETFYDPFAGCNMYE